MYRVEEGECLSCGICIEACEQRALELVDNIAFINQEICNECGQCFEICPADAIVKE